MWVDGHGGCLCPIFVADQFAAEAGEHVGVADGRLLGIPRRGASSFGEVAVGVAVQLIPGDRDRLGQEPERDGPLDRFLNAVAGLVDAVGFGFLMGGLDRPAAVIASDQRVGLGSGVGRRKRDVEPFFGAPGIDVGRPASGTAV